MRMRIANIYDASEIITELKENKVPFTLHTTTMTRKIVTDDTTYSYISNTMPLNMRELNLIKKVKRDAQALDLSQFKKVGAKDVTYINKSTIKLGEEAEGDFYEVDLKQAYWNIAFIKGIISLETYLYANNPKIKKRARLVALGALAKRVTSVSFDGEKYGKIVVGEESEYARLFYACCLEVSGIMQDISREVGEDYIFHWVDAIFLKNSSALERLVTYLNILHAEIKKDFPQFSDVFFKVIPCEKIVRKKNEIIVYSQFHERKKRKFTFEKTIKAVQL
jgi:hypothetical protein